MAIIAGRQTAPRTMAGSTTIMHRYTSGEGFMRKHLMPQALAVLCLASLVLPLAAAIPTTKPEDVGLSAQRLGRIGELMQRHIAAQTFPGAVTLVRAQRAHRPLRGARPDGLETKKPMQKDAIFRIMSMTKPVVGVGDPDAGRGRQGPADGSGLEVHPGAPGALGSGAQYRRPRRAGAFRHRRRAAARAAPCPRTARSPSAIC